MHALILAGGRGTRFWPLSRAALPKQLASLLSDASLLQDTWRRLLPEVPAEQIWVCTTDELSEEVAQQLPELAAAGSDRLLLEPAGRDTLPAIAWAIWQMRGTADVIAVLPSDHWITRPHDFLEALQAAGRAARAEEKIFTLGVRPDRPETGFGYLELAPGTAVEAARPMTLERFVEKPDAARAAEFLASGRYLWNAGMFVFTPQVFLAELERVQPELHARLAELEAARDAGDGEQLARVYDELPRISIDFGLMEQVEQIGVVALDCGWNDLGSFAALHDLLPHDEQDNASRGDSLSIDASDNLLVTDQGTVVVLGVEGLTVVRSGDAVLVMPRERSQDVKRVVEALEAGRREDLL